MSWTIDLLHGFVGRASDWGFLRAYFPDAALHAEDLWPQVPADEAPGDASGLERWARAYTQRLSSDPRGPRFLVGYSMGGRLAMHALCLRPDLWRGALLISAHPGLASKDERAARRRADRRWAERFGDEPWEALLRDWESQPVFDVAEPALGRVRLERPQHAFDRRALVNALDVWSLGAQQDLSAELAALSIPISWVCGESDRKFVDCLKPRAARYGQNLFIVANAGHRVPWDNPDGFADCLRHTLERCTQDARGVRGSSFCVGGVSTRCLTR